jgi:hypothetical protein
MQITLAAPKMINPIPLSHRRRPELSQKRQRGGGIGDRQDQVREFLRQGLLHEGFIRHPETCPIKRGSVQLLQRRRWFVCVQYQMPFQSFAMS